MPLVAEAFEELSCVIEDDGGEIRHMPFGITSALGCLLFNSLGITFKERGARNKVSYCTRRVLEHKLACNLTYVKSLFLDCSQVEISMR